MPILAIWKYKAYMFLSSGSQIHVPCHLYMISNTRHNDVFHSDWVLRPTPNRLQNRSWTLSKAHGSTERRFAPCRSLLDTQRLKSLRGRSCLGHDSFRCGVGFSGVLSFEVAKTEFKYCQVVIEG